MELRVSCDASDEPEGGAASASHRGQNLTDTVHCKAPSLG